MHTGTCNEAFFYSATVIRDDYETPNFYYGKLRELLRFSRVWVTLAAVLRAKQLASRNVDGSRYIFALLSLFAVQDVIFCLSRSPFVKKPLSLDDV